MKKIKYFIFSIALLFVFLIQSNKQVKALEEQEFAPVLIKATWTSARYEQENTYSHEFIVYYKIDYIIIDNLNRLDYFLVSKKYMGMGQGILDRTVNSFIIEEIQIENNSTIFVVRMTLGHNFVNNYYFGIEYLQDFFMYDSALYIKFDMYTLGYNEGYNNGFNDGKITGYDEGYSGGHYVGYEEGFNSGHSIGYDEGYSKGYLIGQDEGYNLGYGVGFFEGRQQGQQEGHQSGYIEGFQDGRAEGWHEGYNFGYSSGYNAGINEQLADKDFTNILKSVFIAIGTFLGINLLPGISIGAIIAVPIVFGIIAFILGRKKD